MLNLFVLHVSFRPKFEENAEILDNVSILYYFYYFFYLQSLGPHPHHVSNSETLGDTIAQESTRLDHFQHHRLYVEISAGAGREQRISG